MDLRFHFFKHIERFNLVFDQRISLPVGTEIDAVAKHIHAVEMFHPLLVNNAQHDEFLKLAHILFTKEQFTALIAIFRDLFQRFLEIVTAELNKLLFFQRSCSCIGLFCICDEVVELPLFWIKLFIRILVHLDLDDVANHPHDIFAEILPEKNLAALAVNDLTLLIHDIVIF